MTTRLTTATRSGIAEFTFPASTRSDLLLKVADSEQRLTTVGGKTVPAYQKVDGTTARIVGESRGHRLGHGRPLLRPALSG